MMKNLFLMSLLLVFLGACSGKTQDTSVFNDQIQSLEKARQVEDQLMDAANLQRQAIEESTE